MVEALGRDADIVQASVVQQYFLQDESGDSLRKFWPKFHYFEAQRYDLSLQKERDDVGIVHFDESANNTKRGQPQVLEGSAIWN